MPDNPSDNNWAPPSGPPITGRKLDPKLLGLGGGVVAALVIAVVAAVSVGGGGNDGAGGRGSGRQYLLGVPDLDALGKAPAKEPSRQWEYDGDTEEVNDVALGEKSVFVLAEDPDGRCMLRALSTDDGKQRWAFELAEENASCGALAVAGERVLASVGIDGDLDTVSLTADKGKEQGRSTIRNVDADISRIVTDPDGEHAYVALLDGAEMRMVRIDVADARRSWAIEGDRLDTGEAGIVLTTEDTVAYVDYETGDTLWEVDADDPLALAAGQYVIVRDGDDLIAYDQDGAKVWTLESADAADVIGGVAGLGGLVLVGDNDRVVVRSLDEGEEQATGSIDGFPWFSDGDRMLFSDTDELARIRRDGDSVDTEQRTDAATRILGARNLVVLAGFDSVRAIDPESFDEAWEIDEALQVRIVDREAMVTVDGEKVTYWR